MGRTPHDAGHPTKPATNAERDEQLEKQPDEKVTAAVLPTRRQFVVGVSGVLAGAACAGSKEPGSGSAGGGGGAVTSSAGANTAGTTASGGAVNGSASGGAASGSGAPGSTASGGASSGGTSGGSTSGGATQVGSSGTPGSSGGATSAGRKAANDQVVLGATGIKVSRLAMGSGTKGSGRGSDQARLGVEQFSGLLKYAYSQGINFFETADAYGAHRHVAEAIRQIGRENVVVLTKTTSETASGVEADLARFRTELGVDMIDIVLLHLKTSSRWTTECEGAMEVLAKAKQSGAIRAHGVSCHSLPALRLAAQTPWVDVDLARINPAGVVMDSDPATVISVLREMKSAGKGVIGMKILGEGQLADRIDMAIKHAVELDCVDAFTIGFTSQQQLDEIVQKIATV